MMSSKSKAVLSFVTVFIIGVAVGVLLENYVLDKKNRAPQHRDPNQMLFEKFTAELTLSSAQQDTLRSLLDDIKDKHRELGRKRHQEYDKIRSEFDAEFRKILTNDQLVKYEELVRQFEERMRDRRENGRRGRPDDRNPADEPTQ